MRYIKEVDEETFTKIVKESNSKSEIARKLGISFYNGSVGNDVNVLLKKYNISVDHFRLNKHQIKYERIEKVCPVCGKKFKEKKGCPKEKITCSCKCSNTYFRSGKNHPNWSDDAYRTTCFLEHEKKCVICGEEQIVEVHHYDGNHSNNKIENLIPLCPTHHKYCHSRYIFDIIDKIDEYIKNFISKRNGV
jgi:hypothetical protein